MQMDFFAQEAPPAPALQLQAHASADYGPRTGENARGADVTVAFAVDFETAGERLTHRVAGPRYVGIALGSNVPAAADQLSAFMAKRNARSLNIAGNGIYTLATQGISQAEVNRWVFEVLSLVHKNRGLTFIRSGGQTGVDTAGLVAGLALGVPVLGLYPKGFRRRLRNKQDVESSPQDLEAELRTAAEALTG